ncbi:hypothetical protein BH09MYX1_BH09MYX1_62230 [soil metagenome]
MVAAAALGALAVVHCTTDPRKPSGPDSGLDTTDERCGSATLCGDACVDLATSITSCGACGKACAAGEKCALGTRRGCATTDVDGDGENACIDCNDADSNVNHAAFDVLGNEKDDDCNGTKDDVVSCEGTPPSNSSSASDYAHAMELCEPSLVAATLTSPDDRARQIATAWGIFGPTAGARFSAFSTGVAAATGSTSPAPILGETPQLGTDFAKTGAPYPGAIGSQMCPSALADPTTANDLTSFTLTLLVPANAHSFSLDVDFLTADAPEWPCSDFDDQALLLLDSLSLKANLLLDGAGRRMSVNHGLVLLKDAPGLAGTGFESLDSNGDVKGASTGWITVSAPVTPRETITLHFFLFDAKDGIYDSQLLVDHFRWSTETLPCPSSSSPLDDAGVGAGCAPLTDAGKD